MGQRAWPGVPREDPTAPRRPRGTKDSGADRGPSNAAHGMTCTLIISKFLSRSHRFHIKGAYPPNVTRSKRKGWDPHDAAGQNGRGHARASRGSRKLPRREPDPPTRSSSSTGRLITSPPEGSSTARTRGRTRSGGSSAATSPTRSGTTGPTTDR